MFNFHGADEPNYSSLVSNTLLYSALWLQVQEQIKTLTMKLEELRVEHSMNEASADSVISSLSDKLSEVDITRLLPANLSEGQGCAGLRC